MAVELFSTFGECVSTKHRLNLAIIDANPLQADGIAALLIQDEAFAARTVYLGSSADGVEESGFDVILIDPAQTVTTPAELVRTLQGKGRSILAYCSSRCETLARTCIQAGFRGVLPKTVSFEVLKIALASMSSGGFFIDAAFAAVMAPRVDAEDSPVRLAPNHRLSEREMFVLKSMAYGKSMKEIGKDLALSSKTIETYKARGSSKLNLSGRRQIIEFAIAQGWVEAGGVPLG